MTDQEIKADGAQALDRALGILRLVGSRSKDGVRLADIVSQSNLAKPTVHRMLKALERNGFIEQSAEDRLYHLGPEAFVLGVLATERFGIHRLASGALQRLSASSQDTVFLSVPRDGHAVCLERLDGAFPIRTHVLQAGDRHPLGVGAGSLAMLAAMSDDEVERILESIAPELASAYPTYTADFLRDAVAETRANGFAFNPGRLLAGSWAIGVAVIGPEGDCVGALSISAIESRLGEARRAELAPIVQHEAQKLSLRLARPEITSPAPEPARSPVRLRKIS
ncbi:MAG: IclR family transcriptional regulator [Caulobacteraceae bacterium]|uniref:IclR family transcriptional regulator n=1 Tax=Brevundimonas sp. G8 TaxID=1350776 RepID=UPI0010EDC1EA|nr:IclR family transcriptional regulator [Brevundimonas sp. G8]RYG09747.1 MAG: IclR family transcriptional regulator [Caulobacteraceae bacterium]VXB16832.1 Transcriptional regulator [Brevundimonas sp. G8]